MEASLANLWRPLGAILIEWQLLSEAQLEVALAEQERSGRRLGEVLVDLDFVQRDVLISVLLEQCGLQSETQGGFGSGLLGELRKRGSVHRRAVPLKVVVVDPDEADETDELAEAVEEPVEAPKVVERRRWGRRKADRVRTEPSAKLSHAFATIETWSSELQREIAEMRRLLTDATR